MQYKTIVLELLEQSPGLSRELRRNDALLSTMNQLAVSFRDLHLRLLDQLTSSQPELDETLLKSQAMEVATEQMQEMIGQAEQLLSNGSVSIEACLALLQADNR